MSYVCVTIASLNGLAPFGAKPFIEAMMIQIKSKHQKTVFDLQAHYMENGGKKHYFATLFKREIEGEHFAASKLHFQPLFVSDTLESIFKNSRDIISVKFLSHQCSIQHIQCSEFWYSSGIIKMQIVLPWMNNVG